jgi:3-methyladenine DNA glycosylase/8-oxoguanine DNA glycosylase
MTVRHRLIPAGSGIDVVMTLGPLRRGRRDPTTRIAGDEFWRATRTPEGPATMRASRRGEGVRVTAWGPGSEWILEHAPAIVGAHDDPRAFVPRHPVLRELHRRFSGLRLGRSGAVVEALVPSVIEQKVTGVEAGRAYDRLVRRACEEAPGRAGLLMPPDPAMLAGLPYYEFHPLGIERRRADTIRRVCARARRIEEIADMDAQSAARRLTAFQGVGAWTAAEVMRVALGDPDAVSVGDFHLPNVVAWVLAGEPRADDERMLALLEPYRGQRARAVRLIELGGSMPPRYGPRMPLRSIGRM